MVGMPVFIDQSDVLVRLESAGVAVGVDKFSDSDTLYGAITEVRDNPAYREKVSRLSELMRDRRHSPMEEAIWLIEYIGRNKGANHLKIASRHLNWVQYYCIDSLAFLVAMAVVMSYSFYWIAVRVTIRSVKKKRD